MMMSKYHSKISQKATYLRVYEDDRMLYGEEVTDIIHKFEKRIVELEDLVKESFEEGYYEGVNFPSPLGGSCKWDESWAKRDLAILKEQVK
jgi:hypothetical protein